MGFFPRNESSMKVKKAAIVSLGAKGMNKLKRCSRGAEKSASSGKPLNSAM